MDFGLVLKEGQASKGTGFGGPGHIIKPREKATVQNYNIQYPSNREEFLNSHFRFG